MVQILLWHKTAHTQDILALLDPQFLEILRIVANFRLRNPIIYKVYVLRPAIFLGDEILDDIRDDNHILYLSS